MNWNRLYNDIIRKIDEVKDAYVQNKGMILTEDDLKCHLFTRLSEISELATPVETYDGHIYSMPLHSELSWFDENQKLTIKPDFTILDPRDLSILKSIHSVKIGPDGLKRGNLPSKEFEFRGDTIILELKFCRYKVGYSSRCCAEIEKDLEKIIRIKNILSQVSNNLFFRAK